MKNDFIQLFSNVEINDRNEAYTYISHKLFENDEQALVVKKALYDREKVGNIQIDTGVVLPHIENEAITETFVAVIQPKETIRDWSKEIKEIELIVAILLSPKETKERKMQIAGFIRKLADEDYIKQLKTTKDIY